LLKTFTNSQELVNLEQVLDHNQDQRLKLKEEV
jgi:hypothetical protein